MQEAMTLELAELAERHRGELPIGFFQSRDFIEASLSAGHWPDELRERAVIGRDEAARLANAVLKELHVLFCTSDSRYKGIREEGDKFCSIAVPAVASSVATALGITSGVATGAVAFVALAVLKIGTAVFCRLSK